MACLAGSEVSIQQYNTKLVVLSLLDRVRGPTEHQIDLLKIFVFDRTASKKTTTKNKKKINKKKPRPKQLHKKCKYKRIMNVIP